MRKINLGIVGVGAEGSFLLNSILEGKCPEIVVTAVADIDPRRLEAVQNKAPQIARYATAEELMDSGQVDSVLIATPHYDHPRYAMEGFKRRLHVMVEKPAGVYTRQVREMNEAAKKTDVVFGMMFNQRTNHIYRKMHEIIQSGALGKIRRTNWIITDWIRTQKYYDSGAWRATWSGEGGGVLLNQCPHQLDLWQWLCGMPRTVEAHLQFGKWHDIEVEDDVTAYVEYENGATGVFVTSTGDFPGSNRLEITLDGGRLIAEAGQYYTKDGVVAQKPMTLTLSRLSMTLPDIIATCSNGYQPVDNYSVETDGKNEQHVGVLNAFAGAILRGEPLVADGSEGLNGLALSNAMHLSAWLGKPVSLPIDEELFYSELSRRVASSRRKVVNESVTVERPRS